MANFEDIELNPSPTGQDGERESNRSKWVLLIVALLLLVAGLGYVAYRQTRPVPVIVQAPEPTLAPTPQPTGLRGDNIALPPLGETDSLVRELVGKLSQHPKVLAWLATSNLIETFTVVTYNISEGQTPVTHLRALKPTAPFRVRTKGAGTIIDPRSYIRYDDYATAVDALDATGTARLYLTLKPRIQDAFTNLGHPGEDFDPVFEKAIAVLFEVPTVDGDIPVREKVITWGLIDPNLEDLNSAQKQLLRMGPRNIPLIQQKLRQIAALLQLHPERPRT